MLFSLPSLHTQDHEGTNVECQNSKTWTLTDTLKNVNLEVADEVVLLAYHHQGSVERTEVKTQKQKIFGIGDLPADMAKSAIFDINLLLIFN